MIRKNFERMDTVISNNAHFDISTKKVTSNGKLLYKGGVPLMYEKGKSRVIIDTEDTHTLVFGATGSLKTRSVVMPTIDILSYVGESMIINDTKGELYTRLSGVLNNNGYDIVVINFRNPRLGNCWNPLKIPFTLYRNGDINRASEFANDIAVNLMLSNASVQDPFWDNSASDLLFGLILLLFRYCKEYGCHENSVNMSNIVVLRRKLFEKGSPSNNLLWKYASEDELIAASLSGSVFAPNDTRNSILSVFDQKMRTFTIQPVLLDMLSNNDFDMVGIAHKKSAVFLITPDEKTSYHKLVSLFVKQSYETLIIDAYNNRLNQLDVRVNYILDEFSALPAIKDMPSMISAARSRNIRFLLVVQSLGSLEIRYAEEAETIISNCTNWIFFTSREIKLLQIISELCGIEKDNSRTISVSELQHLSKKDREALVMSGRYRPALINMIDIDSMEKKIKSIAIMEGKRECRVSIDFALDESVSNRLLHNKNKEEMQISISPIDHFGNRREVELIKKAEEDERNKKLEEERKAEKEKLLSILKDKIDELNTIDRQNKTQKSGKAIKPTNEVPSLLSDTWASDSNKTFEELMHEFSSDDSNKKEDYNE